MQDKKKLSGSSRLYRLLMLILAVALCVSRAQASDLRSAVLQGQSQTLLPNGLILLAGGYGSAQLPVSDMSVVAPDGSVSLLSVKMTYPRAGHTATVLPDGHIMIFGG